MFFLLGILSWLLISIPVWPLWLLIIHRNIHKWLVFWIISSFWIIFSDLFFAYMSRFSIFYIHNFIELHKFIFDIISSIIFFFIWLLFVIKKQKEHKLLHTKKNILRNFWTIFFLNLLNIFNFFYIWIVFSKLLPNDIEPTTRNNFYLLLWSFIWMCIWWISLNFIIHYSKVKIEKIYYVNKIIWFLIIILSIVFFIKHILVW